MKISNTAKGVLVLLVVPAVLFLATAWILGVGPFRPSDQGPVIATVDGEPIYLGEARTRAASLNSVHTGDQGPLTSAEWPDQILGSLVDDKLIQAEAARRDLSVSAQDLATSVQSVVDMFPSLTDYEAWLASEGLDQEEVERRLEQQLLGAAVYDAVTAGVEVSDGQVRAYFEANTGSFTGDDGSPATFEEVREELEAELATEAKDSAFAAWLEERRQQADVVVVVNDWWEDVA